MLLIRMFVTAGRKFVVNELGAQHLKKQRGKFFLKIICWTLSEILPQ